MQLKHNARWAKKKKKQEFNVIYYIKYRSKYAIKQQN